MDVQFGFYQCSPMLNMSRGVIHLDSSDWHNETQISSSIMQWSFIYIIKWKFKQRGANSSANINKRNNNLSLQTTTSHPKQPPLTPNNHLLPQTTTSHPKQPPLTPNNNLSPQHIEHKKDHSSLGFNSASLC